MSESRVQLDFSNPFIGEHLGPERKLCAKFQCILPLVSDYYQYISPIHQSTNPVSVCGNDNLPYLLLVNFNNSFEDLPLKKVNSLLNIVLIYYNVLYLKVYLYV